MILFRIFILLKIEGTSKHRIEEIIEGKTNDSEEYYKISVWKKCGRMNIWTGMRDSFISRVRLEIYPRAGNKH